MKLYELLKDIKFKCSHIDLNTEIKNICSDSRSVSKGDLFIAINGEKRNGNDYIIDALNKGASVIVSQENNKFGEIPYIKVENDREALAKIWNAYYGNPTKDMKVIAFTGTNGKTSCVHLLKSILKRSNKKYGVISTIGSEINGKSVALNEGSEVTDIPSSMTTPDPKYLYELFYKMKNENVEYVIMEASSHSLNQSKLSGVNIHIGAFTNLSSEHLDYHKTINNYFNCKKKLFEACKIGVVNVDNEYGNEIKKAFSNIKTASLKQNADYFGENIIINQNGCQLDIHVNNEKIQVKSKRLGSFAPENIILSAACASILGVAKEDIINGIYDLEYIDGRMEKVRDNIYIDYAHTPEAFERILLSAKNMFNKKIIVLFGCGGDRDKSKRAKMGEIASKYADELIITSDNSRSENTTDIIKDIMGGVKKGKNCVLIPNREDAIKFAIKKLDDNAVLLMLGKGHEKYEINKDGKHYFDEKEIIKEAFNV